MANFTQESRLLELTTPIGKDKLLIRSIDGMESISQLFSFRVECFAANEEVIDFSKLIGQSICVRVLLDAVDPNAPKRFFHGVVQTVTRGARNDFNTSYSLQAVPFFWLLTRTTQSRIFQQKSVPDILKTVLAGIPVAFELQGTYQPRDYCAQYRESDFDFASRLMEEEGIFYFFKHEETNHIMVIADTPTAHKELPHSPTLYYDPDIGGVEDVVTVYCWEKSQTLRSGKTTLWDHSFELPHKSLEAQDLIADTLQVGGVTHKLKVGNNDQMELYDYPGGFAQRFDGVTTGGGDQASELQKIFEDNKRTAKIRMQQEAVNSLNITGYTSYLGITPGFKFALARHYEDNDSYVLTRSHFAIPQMGGYAGDEALDTPGPEIVFNCIPFVLPFRPQRVAAKPVVYGTQTAVVVGPPGEEIYTDKYGRIKVQFLWDRAGKYDASSSCWCRCAYPSAGKNFGFLSIPRIGQEVIVAFEEGDPDQPVVVGSVYNADQMPPHELPANKTQSGVKSRSTPGAGTQNLNEIRFEDKIGAEHIFIHGEKDLHVRCKASYFSSIGGDFNEEVGGDARTKIAGRKSVKVTGDIVSLSEANQTVHAAGDMITKAHATWGGIGQDTILVARAALELKGVGSVRMESGGDLLIQGKDVTIKGDGGFIRIDASGVTIVGTMVRINSGGGAGSASAVAAPTLVVPVAPAAALKPGETKATVNPADSGAAAGENTHDENAEENKDKAHWIEVQLKDESGAPVIGESCEITLPDGKKATSSTNKLGLIRVDKIDAGNCTVRWLELDQDAISQ